MNTVVAWPVIPEVKVLAKVIKPNQSASSPATCRGSKLSTVKRAINVIIPPARKRPGPGIPTIADRVVPRCWAFRRRLRRVRVALMVTQTEFDQLLDLLRGFIRREVMPAEAGIDESDEVPARLIAQAKEMGLYGYALPTEYGGLGLSVEQQVQVTLELGYTSPAFRSLFGTNNG